MAQVRANPVMRESATQMLTVPAEAAVELVWDISALAFRDFV